MRFIEGDITKQRYGFIFHQVNCQGAMGAGVALQIKKVFPIVYREYRKLYRKEGIKLGSTQIIPIKFNEQYVVNVAGQQFYGRIPGHCYTDYAAVEWALRHVREYLKDIYMILNGEFINDKGIVLPTYFPYCMGCSLAGGDWKIVLGIIKRYFPEAVIVRKV